VIGRLLASTGFRVVFGLLGLGFLVLAFLAAWDRSMEAVVPTPAAAVAALAAVLAGHAAGGMGWVVLFEGRGSTRRLVHGLFLAQFGKYIPGGIWQVVGQVGLAAGPGITPARAAATMPVHVVVQLVAAAAVGAPLAALPAVPVPVRAAAAAALLLLPLLHRRWMAEAALRIRRWRGRAPEGGEGGEGGEGPVEPPSQRAILLGFAWSALGIALAGLGFALLLRSLGGVDPLVSGTAIFGLAWLAGFLALPFPSGIGVREAVMLAALGSGAAVIVAASIAHRLTLIAAEAVLAAVTWRPNRSNEA